MNKNKIFFAAIAVFSLTVHADPTPTTTYAAKIINIDPHTINLGFFDMTACAHPGGGSIGVTHNQTVTIKTYVPTGSEPSQVYAVATIGVTPPQTKMDCTYLQDKCVFGPLPDYNISGAAMGTFPDSFTVFGQPDKKCDLTK